MADSDGERILLVASTGGHLDELARLRPRIRPGTAQTEWVTFHTDQAEHLLAGECVHFVPMVRPKDLGATLQTWQPARHLLRRGGFQRVVTTGAAVAVPFLAEARRMGTAAHYIESAARSIAPSLTGRFASLIPGVRLYTQYQSWSTRRWTFQGSVFDGFDSGTRRRSPSINKVVVTLGTQSGFGFERAIRALLPLLADVCEPSASILWQTGASDVAQLGIEGRDLVAPEELRSAIAEADLVVGHAGVGTALAAMEAGKFPVLLPRRGKYREHTDDHQTQIGKELADRGLAASLDPDELSADDLVSAAQSFIVRSADPPAFELRE